MADVKLVILSAFGAGALLILLSLIAVIYLRRRSHRGSPARPVRRLDHHPRHHHQPRRSGRAWLGAVLHPVPPRFLRQRNLDILAAGHPDPALPGPVLGGRRDRHRGPGADRLTRHAHPHLADAQTPRAAEKRAAEWKGIRPDEHTTAGPEAAVPPTVPLPAGQGGKSEGPPPRTRPPRKNRRTKLRIRPPVTPLPRPDRPGTASRAPGIGEPDSGTRDTPMRGTPAPSGAGIHAGRQEEAAGTQAAASSCLTVCPCALGVSRRSG